MKIAQGVRPCGAFIFHILISSTPNFTPSVQRVAHAGRKTSKSASESIKYRRVALRAMLPVKIGLNN